MSTKESVGGDGATDQCFLFASGDRKELKVNGLTPGFNAKATTGTVSITP